MTIDMTRHQGSAGVALVELASKRKQHYIVRTDIRAERSDDGDIVSFIETKFPYKPTLQEIKDFVYEVINKQTDAKILCGYPWTVLHGDDAGKDVKVWLSNENQTNYKAKYDLHFQKPEALTWPTTYKIAEDENKVGIFEEFANFEELEQFYLGGIAYIESAVQAGWAEKKAIDWTPYEQQLSALLGE